MLIFISVWANNEKKKGHSYWCPGLGISKSGNPKQDAYYYILFGFASKMQSFIY